MLVLTRRSGEKIMIGDDIVVSIVEVGRDKVRIGVNAPKNVGVDREEIYYRKKSQKRKQAEG